MNIWNKIFNQNNPYYTFHKKIALGYVVFLVLSLIYLWWTLPPVEEVNVENAARATEIYSRDGVLLARLSIEEEKDFAKPKEIPLALKKALICAEDPTFNYHNGIAFRNFFRSNAKKSTITQRLARMYIADKGGAWLGIFKILQEWILTYQLEQKYTKDEILTFYLNYVNFGGIITGVNAASNAFFGKTPDKLEPEECILLASVLKAPSYYNPIKHKSRAIKRRNEVIDLMYKEGYISKKDAEYLKSKQLVIRKKRNIKPKSHKRGLAPYFVQQVKKELKIWGKKKGIDIYKAGLKIYTTLDSRLQRHADSAMMEHLSVHQRYLEREFKYFGAPWEKDSNILIAAMKRSNRYKQAKAEGYTDSEIRQEFNEPIRMKVFSWEDKDFTKDTTLSPWDSLKYYAKFLQPAVLVLNPKNGHVLAWVGGIDANYFHYDHVAYGKRQVGSTFKPFVYTAAFDKGFKPCDQEPNQYISFPTREGKLWTPRNSDGEVGQDTCLRDAIAGSINIVAVRITHKVGVQTVVDYAHRLGIQSFLDTVPSIGLGPMELGVIEMTTAYATFANYGNKIEPILISHIENSQGDIIERFTPKIERVLNEFTAYTMIQMLRSVVDLGTGSNLRWQYEVPYDIEVGGKTGTSQNHSDGWFIGFTTDLVVGCWVGCDDRRVHFLSMDFGQGKAMALPIVAKFLKRAYEDPALNLPKSKFRRPNGFNIDTWCHPLIYKKDTLKTDTLPPIDTIPLPPTNYNPDVDLSDLEF